MNLVSERMLINARRERHEYVEAVRVAFELKVSSDPDSVSVSTYRCNERHAGSKRPVVAKVFRTYDLPALFVSRIEWMPSDQLTLRPWQRHELLGTAMDDFTVHLCMTDDELLERTVTNFDEWSAGQRATGERWVRDMPTTLVAEVVEPVPPAGARHLWIRCPRCAESAELDPIKILNDTRQ